MERWAEGLRNEGTKTRMVRLYIWQVIACILTCVNISELKYQFPFIFINHLILGTQHFPYIESALLKKYQKN